jgi:NADP-dependent 3-hydroxy acid dehydrogenase YdfG
MTMKAIMVIGSSTGIGKSIVDYFTSKGHEVISVGRKESATVTGDITDEKFRDMLVSNYSPDVVVNCAGMVTGTTSEMLLLNHVAIADLTVKFYEKLKPGSHVINISSLGAMFSNIGTVPKEYMVYFNSKNAMSQLTLAFANSHRYDVRITTLEPEIVQPTDLHQISKDPVPEERYTSYNFENFTPLPPAYMAEVIDWIINQPRWVNISRMTINNNCKEMKNLKLK